MTITFTLVPEFTRPGRRVVKDRLALLVELFCDECDGTGTITCDNGTDGFQRMFTCSCTECDGEGLVRKEVSEDDL